MKLPAEVKAERLQWSEDQVRRMLAAEDRLASCWRLALGAVSKIHSAV